MVHQQIGRPPKHGSQAKTHFTFQLPLELMTRINTLAFWWQRQHPDLLVSRSDALRMLIEEALPQYETRYFEQGDTTYA